jgi:crotonobetainyl-CoA:carnitine CoA-transferase CaiB-like acyl-CoA transferase
VRGRIGIVGPPVKMSDTATGFERPAPVIGEHTDEVLREFGIDAAEIAGLRAAGIL